MRQLRDDAFYEAAAKRYCELIGVDPGQDVHHSPEPNANGSVNAVLLTSPYYKRVAKDLKQHHAIRLALEYTALRLNDPLAPTDPCPNCVPGTVCRTMQCGRLKTKLQFETKLT